MELFYQRVPIDTKKEVKKDYKSGLIKKKYVQYWAYKNEFSKVLSQPELKIAKEEGQLPERFSLHHIIPISGGGTNHFTNLVILPVDYHIWVHKDVLDPQVRNLREGESILIKAYPNFFDERPIYIPTEKEYNRQIQEVNRVLNPIKPQHLLILENILINSKLKEAYAR